MDNLRDQLPVSYSITAQLVSLDLSGFTAIISQQPPEKSLRSGTITLCLEKYINNFAILVNSPPQVMLLAIDLHKDFIDVERVTIAWP